VSGLDLKKVAHLEKIYKYIDDNQQLYVKRLSDAVAIRSVSAWPETRDEVIKMMHIVADQLKELQCTVDLMDIGEHLHFVLHVIGPCAFISVALV